MTEISTILVRNAIDKIRQIDPEYWETTLQSRLVNGVGSRTSFTDKGELEAHLKEANWFPYDHTSVAKGCIAFRTNEISGMVGVAAIMDTDKVTYGEKGGKVFATINRAEMLECGFTVLIIGPEGKCWTFHPGDPVSPSSNTDLSLVGTTEDGSKAKERGFVYAKMV